MKADDRRPRLFNDRAHGRVEGRADRRGRDGGWVEARLGIVGRELLASAHHSRIGLGSPWVKKLTLKGASVACLMAAICSAQAVGREHRRRQ